ncbi:MAG: hypothetical protein M1831_003230 [Alyxoria varia]|nr:MAG: hypothetical protein M1831_003230 [Alyxoria varia]
MSVPLGSNLTLLAGTGPVEPAQKRERAAASSARKARWGRLRRWFAKIKAYKGWRVGASSSANPTACNEDLHHDLHRQGGGDPPTEATSQPNLKEPTPSSHHQRLRPAPQPSQHEGLRGGSRGGSNDPENSDHRKRESSISSLPKDLKSSIRRRSASLRSNQQRPSISHTNSSNSSVALPTHQLPDPHPGNRVDPADLQGLRSASNASLRPINTTVHANKSTESLNRDAGSARTIPTPSTANSGNNPPRSLPIHPRLRGDDSHRPATAGSLSQAGDITSAPVGEKSTGSSATRSISGRHHTGTFSNASGVASSDNKSNYHRIQSVLPKRLDTLAYLRDLHTGSTYWFNTSHYTRPELEAKVPYFNPDKLVRRGSNFLVLGWSLTRLKDNSNNLTEFLKMFLSILSEFESYQLAHPIDGSGGTFGGGGSAFNKMRMGTSFLRRNQGGGGVVSGVMKGRRGSSAVDMGGGGGGGGDGVSEPSTSTRTVSGGPAGQSHNSSNPLSAGSNHSGHGGLGIGNASPPSASAPTFSGSGYPSGGAGGGGTTSEPSINAGSTGTPAGTLHPGEEYTHLIVMPQPFDVDYYQTFAALCDCAIDTYARISRLAGSAEVCGPNVADLFSKADAKVRKLVTSEITKDMEGRSKDGVRREMAGVGRLIMGSLM